MNLIARFDISLSQFSPIEIYLIGFCDAVFTVLAVFYVVSKISH